MTSLLKDLLGDDNQAKRTQAEDFVNRYDDGPPTDGFSDDEAIERYDEVAGELSPEEYQQFATEAFERMSPQQRQEFGQMLMRHGNENGVPMNADDPFDNQYDDPRQLARLASQFQQQPIGLTGLFGMGGGGPGGGLGGMLGGFGGGQQYGSFRRPSGVAGMMSNPIARAAIGGIAAMAFRQLLGRR